MIDKLAELLALMWQRRTIPQQQKDASIVHLLKKNVIGTSLTITEVSPCGLQQDILALIMLHRFIKIISDRQSVRLQMRARNN